MSMHFASLSELTFQSRSMREIGIALVATSSILALFLVYPLTQPPTPAALPAAVIGSDIATTSPTVFENTPILAKAAIVYDLATGETLFAKNADAQLPLASLTKMLAVYAAVDKLALSTRITIPADVVDIEYPRAFNEGQVLSLGDISRLTLTASLNDGAAAIVRATAEQTGTTEGQVLANAAGKLHLAQTFALNGNGLDMTTSVSGGYGSARDMARLAGALVDRAPTIARATTENTATARSEGGTTFRVKNTDPIVDTIPHLLLSKTGFTDLAGGNLALVIDVGINHPVAIIVLGSSVTERFTDSSALIAATLAYFAGQPAP